MSPAAAVVGGGLAGIAAALRLAEAGVAVTLVEERRVLGGRAASYIDAASGQRIDRCQHITMRCCTNLADLLQRLGARDAIRYHDATRFIDRQGRRHTLRASPLPAPLHALPSFARFAALSVRDRASVARGLVRILRTPLTIDLDCHSMDAWASNQTRGARDRFWRPIVVSACNADLHAVSCLVGFKVFRDGFLVHPRASQLGIPTAPLEDLYDAPSVRALERLGAVVIRGQRVKALLMEGDAVAGARLAGGQVVRANAVVCAVPFDRLPALLPAAAAADRFFSRISGLRWSPIVGVHVWPARPVAAPDAAALLDRTMQWVFTHGDRISLVVSAAHALAKMPREDVARVALADLRGIVPAPNALEGARTTVVKERRATFEPRPGSDALRPGQRTPLAGLFLAGDWTQTGWPATMEGAVRSGYLAAERVLQAAGRAERLLVDDLCPSALALRMMGRLGGG